MSLHYVEYLASNFSTRESSMNTPYRQINYQLLYDQNYNLPIEKYYNDSASEVCTHFVGILDAWQLDHLSFQ